MKISPVTNTTNRSHFKATVQENNKTVTVPEQKQNTDRGIVILGTLGVAAIGLYALRHRGIRNVNDLKASTRNFKNNINKKIASNKRGPEALRRYQYQENQRKLESLHKRLFDGEFSDKTPEAMKKIIRNEIKLAHATGRLTKA